MIVDLNAGHYRCEVFRYSLPLQLQRPPHPPRLAPIRGFLFFSAPEPLVILFPRRFRAVPPPRPRPRRRRILIGNLYRTTRFSHPFLPSLPPPSPPPPPSPSKLSSTSRLGQRALSRKRIWKWVEAMVLTSFGFVLLLFCLPPGNRQCIFYNAAMSRWPGVARRPFSPALTVPGAPLNPATTSFRRDDLSIVRAPVMRFRPSRFELKIALSLVSLFSSFRSPAIYCSNNISFGSGHNTREREKERER